jgi:ATP-binding cassette subfamily C protein
MRLFRMCGPYFRKFRVFISLYIALTFVNSIIGLFIPLIIGNFIDQLAYYKNNTAIVNYCIIFGAVNILLLIFNYIVTFVYTKLQTAMGFQFNRDVLYHLQRVPLTYFDNKDIIFISQIVNADTNALVIFCLNVLQNITSNVVIAIISFAIIFQLSIKLFVVCLVMLAVYAVVYFYIKILYFIFQPSIKIYRPRFLAASSIKFNTLNS